MKTSYSIAFFIVLLLVVVGVVFFYEQRTADDTKVLVQTLECYSEKIDTSVADLDADTSLIGAMVTFKTVPLEQSTREKLAELQVELDEQSWIFDYVVAKIPTDSLCQLAEQEEVVKIFIPEL